MSFGWSAGDITTLVSLTIKIVKALDSSGGSTKHYREATAFLQTVKDTIEPLQDSSLLEAYPTHREQICQQVNKIKLVIDNFLKVAAKFEPQLGGTEAIRHHQHLLPKLKWRFITSKALVELLTELSGYKSVVDTLLLRVLVEKGNKHDDQIRTIQPRLDLVQKTLQAQIETIEQNGKEYSGTILSRIEAKFEPLKEDLVERDQELSACIEKLREDLSPLRDDLEKVERTREAQHWTLVHSIQQQTAAIGPLDKKIASIQLTANQNFSDVLTKLDTNTAALDEVNKKVNTMGLVLWDLKNQPAELVRDSARRLCLGQKRDDNCFPFPQIKDHGSCSNTQQLENKLLGIIASVEQGHEEKHAACRTTIESTNFFGNNVFTKGQGNESVVPYIKDKSLADDVDVARSFKSPGDAMAEANNPTTLATSQPNQIRPAKELLASQHNRAVLELLQVVVNKITALEERVHDQAPEAEIPWVGSSGVAPSETDSPTGILAQEPTRTTQRSARPKKARNTSYRNASFYQVSEAAPNEVSYETYDSSYSKLHPHEIYSNVVNASSSSGPSPYYVSSESYNSSYSGSRQRPSSQYGPGLAAAAVGLTVGLGSAALLPYMTKKSEAKKQELNPDLGNDQVISVKPSFLFVVNRQTLNEDPDRGGMPPQADPNGYWFPPAFAAGYGTQYAGTVYRWDDGRVTRVKDAMVRYDGLTTYRSVTMFYGNPFYQFFVTEGDASVRNMPDSQPPQYQWHPLHFKYGSYGDTVSYLDLEGEYNCLVGNEAGFISRLGLDSYSNRQDDAPRAGGLAGNLAILLALIAFSCKEKELDTVLIDDQAWLHGRWKSSQRRDGRREGRGLFVSIYLDPENTKGSTKYTLNQLEWNMGALLR